MTAPLADRASAAARVAPGATPPEVAVVIATHGAAPGRAGHGRGGAGPIRSVLAQTGVGLRLVLVGERRADAGAALAGALDTGAAFVVRLEPDARLLPGALRRLVDACGSSSDVGSVFPFHFEADGAGQVSRQGHRRTRRRLLPLAQRGFDARRELAAGRPLPGACRIYRREALQQAGLGPPVRGRAPGRHLSPYALDLRVAEGFRIACLPEFLCVAREEAPGRWVPLARRLGCLADLWRARRDDRAPWLREAPGPSLAREALRAAGTALPGAETWRAARARRKERRSLRPVERRRPFLEWLHGLAAARLGAWPLDWGRPRRHGPAPAPPPARIAYYLWHFPVLSQTFVRREVAALRAGGIDVLVAADDPEDEELLGEEGPALVAATRYTSAVTEAERATFLRRLARRKPFALANAFLFVVSRRFGRRKTLALDLAVFRAAVRLAALLEPERPQRLHAPGADRCAFIGLVASRLLGIPFSVQARSHELHDPGFRYPLPDVFRHADVIVTNAAYNVPFIQAHLDGRRDAPPVEVIHEGVEIERCVPRERTIAVTSRFAPADPRVGGSPPAPVRLLCVGRLIEEKGVLVLLRACALLRERGLRAPCEVVGGPEQPLHTNYLLAIRREHRRLELEELVRFTGAIPFDAVLEAYARADVFVLPCVVSESGRRDVTPNVLLEAMAMRLPVVSTTVGGIPELVEDGVSGLLVAPGDPEALAGALAGLIEDPDRRERLGAAGRVRVETLFDVRGTSARYRELFTGTPAAAPGPPRR